MESERYRKFLESESRKAPIEKKQSDVKERFWLSWRENKDRAVIERGASDFIDSLYFGEDPSRTVVMDRKVARMVQDRLKGLEEENIQVHNRLRIMKIVVYTLLLVIFAMALIIARLALQ